MSHSKNKSTENKNIQGQKIGIKYEIFMCFKHESHFAAIATANNLHLDIVMDSSHSSSHHTKCIIIIR